MLAEKPQVCFHPSVVFKFLVICRYIAVGPRIRLWQLTTSYFATDAPPFLLPLGFGFFYQIPVFFTFRFRPFDVVDASSIVSTSRRAPKSRFMRLKGPL